MHKWNNNEIRRMRKLPLYIASSNRLEASANQLEMIKFES